MISALQQAGQVANTMYERACEGTASFVASVKKNPTTAAAAVIGTAIIATAGTVYFTDAHQPVINTAKYLLGIKDPSFVERCWQIIGNITVSAS